jgi:hypothetical protein
MKFKYTTGCLYDNLEINGKDIKEFSEDEIREYVTYAVNNIKADKDDLIFLLKELVEQYGEYKFLYQCEDCFDNVSESTLEI